MHCYDIERDAVLGIPGEVQGKCKYVSVGYRQSCAIDVGDHLWCWAHGEGV